MERSDPLYPFLLALSFYEKSDEEMGKWQEVRKVSRVDNSQYDSVLASYGKHRRQAHAYLREMRREAARTLPDEERELGELIGRLRKLSRDATKGRIKPDKANVESARIQDKIAPLQEIVVLHQTIVEAESTDELGGRIELSLDDYGVKIRKLGFTADPERMAKDDEEKERREIPFYLIAFVLVAVALIVFYPTMTGNTQMRFLMQRSGDQVIVFCHNRGSDATYFYAPWPDGIPSPQGMSPRGRSFGVRIHVREKALGAWQLLPDSEGAWYQQQTKLMESGPYTIEAASSKRFQLHLSELRVEGVDADATRIQIVSGRGRVVRELIIE